MISAFTRYLKEHWRPLLVMMVIWLLLEIPAVYGHQSILFYPAYFLTGALAGVTGGGYLGMVGGAVARAIIYVFFEQIIVVLCFSKLSWSEKLSSCKKILLEKLQGVIPYFNDLKSLITNDMHVLSTELAGFGTAIILAMFLSGTAVIRNSFVSLVMFITITNELKSHSGLIFSLTRMIFRKFGKKEPDKDLLAKFLSAHALGYAAGQLFPGKDPAIYCGIALLLVAMLLSFLSKKEAKV